MESLPFVTIGYRRNGNASVTVTNEHKDFEAARREVLRLLGPKCLCDFVELKERTPNGLNLKSCYER